MSVYPPIVIIGRWCIIYRPLLLPTCSWVEYLRLHNTWDYNIIQHTLLRAWCDCCLFFVLSFQLFGKTLVFQFRSVAPPGVFHILRLHPLNCVALQFYVPLFSVVVFLATLWTQYNSECLWRSVCLCIVGSSQCWVLVWIILKWGGKVVGLLVVMSGLVLGNVLVGAADIAWGICWS